MELKTTFQATIYQHTQHLIKIMASLSIFLLCAFIYTLPVITGMFLLRLIFHKNPCRELVVLMCVMPVLWITLCFISDKGKSLSNAVIEPLLLALVALIIVVFSFFLAKRLAPLSGFQVLVYYLFGFASVWLIWLFLPALPE